MMVLVLTLVSAILFARSGFAMSPTDIANSQGLKFGYNSDIVRSLASQGADTRVGVLLLLTSFALQARLLSQTTTFASFARPNGRDVRVAIGLGIVILVGALVASGLWADSLERDAMKILLDRNP